MTVALVIFLVVVALGFVGYLLIRGMSDGQTRLTDSDYRAKLAASAAPVHTP